MMRFFCARFLVAVAAPLMSTSAAFTLPSEQKAAANHIAGLMIDCRFNEALAMADSMVAAATDDPMGYLLRLCAIGLRDLDWDDVRPSADFERTYARLSLLLAGRCGGGNPSVYCLTVRGYADAAYASHCLRRKQYGAGVRTGLSALGDLKRAKELDPSNRDVDFFLGLYEYSKAELRKRLRWVLFWYPGSRKEGIRRLEECAAGAEFSRLGAVLALADIYAGEGVFDRSSRLIDSVLLVYPNSRFMVWSRCRLFEAERNFAGAASGYESLAAQYESIAGAERSAALTRHHHAVMLDRAGRASESLAACAFFLDRYGSREDPYVRELVRDAERLRERLGRDGKG